MAKRCIGSVVFVFLAVTGSARADDAVSLAAARPVVVRTLPAGGSDDVDSGVTEIRVTYSKDMADGTWSWSTWGTDTFPDLTGKPHYLTDKRTCVAPVHLLPGRTYATWLNSDNFSNFKDAAGHPAVPYLLVFKTRGLAAPAAATKPAERVQATAPGDLGPQHQVLLPGMTLVADQPKGANREVRPSPDGRYDAFLSTAGDACRVVVVDRRTGTPAEVPAPAERVMEARSVRQFGWDRSGRTLYVVEDGTTGARTRAEWKRLTPDGMTDQIQHHIYEVLYAWTPGAATAPVVGRVDGFVLTLAGVDRGVQLLTSSSQGMGYGWDSVDLHEFRRGRPATVRTVRLRRGGKPADCLWPQLLPDHHELWFASRDDDRSGRSPLVVVDLSRPDADARVVVADVRRFAWSGDEQRLVVQQRSPAGRYDLRLVRREAVGTPPVHPTTEPATASCPFLPVGISNDGRTLYVQGLSAEAGNTDHLTFDALRDGLRVYRYDLPL